MNELEILLMQFLNYWQKNQEQSITAQNIRIEKLEEELAIQCMHQEAMQTQLDELQDSLSNLEPLLKRLNEALRRI